MSGGHEVDEAAQLERYRGWGSKRETPGNTGEAGTWTFSPTGGVKSCPGGAGNCFERNGLVFFGINTLGDFDRIEASITITNLPAPLELRELCVK